MITLTTEQAQQIEEALVKIADLRNLGKIQPEVIAFETLYVIRAARAQEQAEQEPVAWLYDWEHEGEIVTGWVTQDFETTKFNNSHNVRPLYAAPVRTKDLTDYEIVRLYAESPMCDSEMIAFARAVIAADREKNKC